MNENKEINQQTNDVTIDEIKEPVEAPNQDSTAESASKVWTEDEVNKLIQSEKSKAKYALMQEFGVKSVDEFKTLKETYEKSINEKSELEAGRDTLMKENSTLKEDLVMAKLGVSDDYKEDLLKLAREKVDDTHSLEDVSKDLVKRFPQMLGNTQVVKTGVEKTETMHKQGPSEELTKRFPWLLK